MFQSPGDIAFTIGEIEVYWYGIIMSLSMLVAIFVVNLIAKKFYKEITFDIICDISFVLITAGLIFARLYYIILDYKYFMKVPEEIIAIWNGGISIQGAILGGILTGWFYSKELKLPFLRLADLFSFGLISGQIIGRWGNFFNSEAFGFPTDLPWKLYIPLSNRPVEYRNFEYFHPAFLYESLLNIIVLLIMLFLLKKNNPQKNGIIFFTYITLYSIVRIIVEAIRTDSVLNIAGIHVAHITCVIFLIIGVTELIIINKKKSVL